MLKKNWKAVLVLALLAAYSSWLWDTSAALVRAEWDRDRASRAESEAAAARLNAKKIFDLQGEKNENLKRIAALDAELADVRVRVPVCPGPNSTAGVAGTATGAGALQETAQTGFDEFRQSLESSADRCDKLVENCRVVMEWAKSKELPAPAPGDE